MTRRRAPRAPKKIAHPLPPSPWRVVAEGWAAHLASANGEYLATVANATRLVSDPHNYAEDRATALCAAFNAVARTGDDAEAVECRAQEAANMLLVLGSRRFKGLRLTRHGWLCDIQAAPGQFRAFLGDTPAQVVANAAVWLRELEGGDA